MANNIEETESEYIQRRIKFEEEVLKELKARRSELILSESQSGHTLKQISEFWGMTEYNVWQTIWPAFKESDKSITITKE